MIRKLTFALSLLGVCFTGFVHALGLGEVTVKSALNQPLTAEIELVNSSELGVNEILPGLATREEFLKANVDRVYFLSDIRFNVETNANGKLVVVLTTKKPVREPFLNFLVEVIWPSGRLLREYALLIDPPVFTEEKTKAVRPASANNVSSGDVLAVSSQPVSRSILAPQDSVQGGVYGPTNANDTLWEIAIKARPNRKVSPQQVMLAIQDLNPNAFIQQNINKLKAGQVLRLPTYEQIQQRNLSQAIQEVITQNEATRPKRTKSVASVIKNISPSTIKSPEKDELKLVVDNKKSTNAESANSGQSANSGNGSAANQKLAITLEKLDKATIDNTELNSRVSDLEEQLQTLQRLLTLKNDHLANIQTQMRANEQAKLEAQQKSANDSLNKDSGLPKAANDIGDNANVAVNEATLTKTISKDIADQAPPKKDTSKEAVEMPVDKGVSKLSETSSVVDTAVVESDTSKETENLIQTIISNPLYFAILVVGVLLLVVLLWFVSRSNAQKEQEYQALNPSEDDNLDELEDEYESFNEGNETEIEETLENDDYEEELGSEGHEAESESEDVIAEADVYIAYGRLDQAASVLEDAISAEPVRTDYRLKLLTVYKEAKDVEAFNRQFSELEAIQDATAIEEAAQIRADMLDDELVSLEDKESALLQTRDIEEEVDNKAKVESTLECEAEALENEGQSFDFDSVSLEESGESDIDFSSEELSLDLDLDDALLNAPEDDLIDTAVSDKESAFSPSLDDETSDVGMSSESLSLDAVLNESDSTDELSEDLDLSEDLGLAEDSDLSEGLLAADDFDDDMLDVDLDDIDLSGELDQESEISLPGEFSEGLGEGASGLGVDASNILDADNLVVSDDILEEATEAFNNDSDEEMDLDAGLGDAEEFDFLEGTDESSTKLDLARAYIDMGDLDGAKDILDEVTKEGSSEQQAEAKDLLSSIDS